MLKIICMVLLFVMYCGLAVRAEEPHPISLNRRDDEVTSKVKSLAKTFDLNSDVGYFQALSTLEKENPDGLVEVNIKGFLENSENRLSLLTKKYLFRTEHSENWVNLLADASESAKKEDWKSCEVSATKGLREKQDAPVFIFLRAVARKKLNENELSLTDLDYLYLVRKSRKWDPDWNKYRGQEEREFFNFLMI